MEPMQRNFIHHQILKKSANQVAAKNVATVLTYVKRHKNKLCNIQSQMHLQFKHNGKK